MAEKSRTEHSVRNTTAAMVSKIMAILMGFATRVVFTHCLSESYVGINGLFSDILNVLALSEEWERLLPMPYISLLQREILRSRNRSCCYIGSFIDWLPVSF